MAADLDAIRRNAILLSEESIGVRTEDDARLIRPNGNSLYTSLSPTWLELLNICHAKAETKHSLSLGRQPVIVQKPAIIVQPADVVDQDMAAIPGGERPW